MDIQMAYCDSPLGLIEISATEKGIRSVGFVEAQASFESSDNKHLSKCKKELEEYFNGERRNFTVSLDWKGTDFQKSVWDILMEIPYSKTISYMDIAKRLDNLKAIRAVGSANGRNKIAIIVPCHRVIGSDGQLTGYAAGLPRKEWLLKHEGNPAFSQNQMTLF
ncbi:methylated-DNA--[protein]-cysteine S-methyltransferase [Fulvivirgaceae bacterium BMA10]|uniref:Methylated-DNA--protein-cysteine methyltransferase n=1 Tax=Splendidivirga corallicola TaxID=3051826 RepID=A0ABT8KTS5_9BACT|nr:methylated-DNA--[protein]-cysteine S-methyltransferase [Fulvivirgaceae bacterium BMA10]